MRRLKQQDVLDYLEYYPGATETEIQIEVWDYYRNTRFNNKKYSYVLRRALHSGKIKRIKVRVKPESSKYVFRYCLASQSFDVIFSQIRN